MGDRRVAVEDSVEELGAEGLEGFAVEALEEVEGLADEREGLSGKWVVV